jgi:hypothetical protein
VIVTAEELEPKLDKSRRYTTSKFMAFIKGAAGVMGWDLDPAADLESHHAPRWLCAPGEFAGAPDLERAAELQGCLGEDGLALSWLPGPGRHLPMFWRVFVNPPFSNIEPWLAKTWDTIAKANDIGLAVRIAMVLPANRVEQPFWQEHVEPFLSGHWAQGREGYQLTAHSPKGRQFYGHPGNPEPESGAAEWPSLVLVWRRA